MRMGLCERCGEVFLSMETIEFLCWHEVNDRHAWNESHEAEWYNVCSGCYGVYQQCSQNEGGGVE